MAVELAFAHARVSPIVDVHHNGNITLPIQLRTKMFKKFFQPFIDPTAAEIATKQLRHAEADRLLYLAKAEECRAMADMLGDRIARLKLEAGDAS